MSAAGTAAMVERHRSGRAGWLRAAVLGADDGIVSVASLMIGVAASSGTRAAVLTAGFAGLVAGAMSMAAGEYVSVSSQRDAERADLRREEGELQANPEAELLELTDVYRRRGVRDDVARAVAVDLMATDALAAHARDELGFASATQARPVQAALVSAASFAIGALVPLLAMVLAPPGGGGRTLIIASAALGALAALGAWGAQLGGAPRLRAVLRLAAGGGAAMLVTAGVGRLIGSAGL